MKTFFDQLYEVMIENTNDEDVIYVQGNVELEFKIDRLNLDLALYRDDKGALGCVVDQCSHRGAALSLEKMSA